MQLVVTVKLLNKRRVVPVVFPDSGNIIGEVKEGFSFEGVEADVTEVPNPALGKWYKDRDGHFYWGGGVNELEQLSVESSDFETFNNKDWGFIDFRIDELWNLSKGKDIKVAILDSGLKFNLDDFKDKSDIIFYNAFLDSDKKEDCVDDTFLHGTDCAGMLFAQGIQLCGVAPEITLIIVRITNPQGERKTQAIIKGLEKAIALNADVISLSFSMAKDGNFDTIHQKIKEAYQKNITLLASAGDSGGLNFPVDNFPASFPECLSIGGITRNKVRSKASTKSNFLDLMGPGEDLASVVNPAIRIKGTSFSTPFVAGVIALLKSIARINNKPLDNIKLYDILKRAADKNSIANYNTIDHGSGILDPLKTVNMLLQS